MRLTRHVCSALLLAVVQIGSSLDSAPQAFSLDPAIVISQVYGGGGNVGAVYRNDFVELYNRSTARVNLRGLSVQYASAAGTGNFGSNPVAAFTTDLFLEPGQYLVIRSLAGGTNGVPLPEPVFPGTATNLAAGAGKVALVQGTAGLGCNGGSTVCTDAQKALIIDLVGYGNANFFEGTAAAPTASNGTAVIRKGDGAVDTNDNAADFVVAAPVPHNRGLAIADLVFAEGDATTEATFTVTLGSPSGTPVTFTVSTEDLTATAGSDYIAVPPTPVSIPAGHTSVSVSVTILGDAAREPDEQFLVLITDVLGSPVADDRAIGTILNDEEYAIHELQGRDPASPLLNQSAATRGIVTARKGNGFFIQTPDEQADRDPETSEGLFVFTSSRPTVTAGDAVQVWGRVVEFSAGSDTLTEITSPAITVLTRGNPLPAPVPVATLLTLPTDPAYRSRNQQLERFEGMLVQANSLEVVAPTNTFGEFYAVLPGTPRPFREPGIDVGDVLPAGAPATVPRFDGNFEKLMLDSNDLLDEATGNARPRLDVAAGEQVVNVAGPLDYAFGNYRIALTADAAASGRRVPQPVPARTAAEFTIGHVNLENYRNVSAGRELKAARLIVEILRTPDILGLIEVGTQKDVQDLAAAVNAIAGTSYVGYLHDNDGNVTASEQNIGYLINASRVEVLAEHQEYAGKTWTIGGVVDDLHDRPPHLLRARIRHTGTEVTVILNHLKSLIDVNSHAPYGDGTVTVGYRNREKRRLQGEDLADLITLHAEQNLVVLGDMNAFEVNDGYTDMLGILQGTPAAEAFVTNYSEDRWSYELRNLVTELRAVERYSYVFDGNAQVLDHILVNQPMFARLTGFAYSRNNADFPEVFETDFGVTTRVSDHDGPVAAFRAIADLTTTTTMPALVTAGSGFTYNVAVANAGDTANNVTATLTLPSNAVFGGVLAPAGWSCSNVAPTVTCSTASFPAGGTATFVVSMTAACAIPDGTTLQATTTAASPTEVNTSNNASSGSTVISNPAPVISGASVDRNLLWPPYHQMENVRVFYSTTDNCGMVTTSLAVTSNEPINGLGDGDTGPDWQVLDSNRVRLRAERSATGTGRIYAIRITATDSAGHASSQTVTVTVPLSR